MRAVCTQIASPRPAWQVALLSVLKGFRPITDACKRAENDLGEVEASAVSKIVSIQLPPWMLGVDLRESNRMKKPDNLAEIEESISKLAPLGAKSVRKSGLIELIEVQERYLPYIVNSIISQYQIGHLLTQLNLINHCAEIGERPKKLRYPLSFKLVIYGPAHKRVELILHQFDQNVSARSIAVEVVKQSASRSPILVMNDSDTRNRAELKKWMGKTMKRGIAIRRAFNWVTTAKNSLLPVMILHTELDDGLIFWDGNRGEDWMSACSLCDSFGLGSANMISSTIARIRSRSDWVL